VFLLVLAVLAMLLRSEAAHGQVDAQARSPALPQDGDLTLGGEAGSVLIGLTIRPSLPGPNALLLNVLPLGGASAAADVPLALAIDGRSVGSVAVSVHAELISGPPVRTTQVVPHLRGLQVQQVCLLDGLLHLHVQRRRAVSQPAVPLLGTAKRHSSLSATPARPGKHHRFPQHVL
jgi:hypothetical protein